MRLIVRFFVLIAVAIYACCFFWTPVTELLHWSFKDPRSFWEPDLESMFQGSGVYETLSARNMLFDDLMRIILQPRARCLSRVVLGGVRKAFNSKIDGDKVLCLEPGPGILLNDCLVYSFGINDEWSFDEVIREKFGCDVHCFDPSMEQGDHLHSRGVHFHDIGIGTFDGHKTVDYFNPWKIRTLSTILSELGHENRTLDVLKIDIEGDELGVLEHLLDKGLLKRVNHLCVEMHLGWYQYWERWLSVLRRMESESDLRHFSTTNNTQALPRRVHGFRNRYEQLFFEMSWCRL